MHVKQWDYLAKAKYLEYNFKEMTYYEELIEFTDGLSDKEKTRLIYRFILRLPADKIAELDNISHCRIHQTLNCIEKKFKKFHSHNEIISALQEIFNL